MSAPENAVSSHDIRTLASSILSSRSKIVFTAVRFNTATDHLWTIAGLTDARKKHRSLFHACAAVDSLLNVS